MTRRDYLKLSTAFRKGMTAALQTSADPQAAEYAALSIMEEITAALSENNPRFDADRFQRDCQPGGYSPSVVQATRGKHAGVAVVNTFG